MGKAFLISSRESLTILLDIRAQLLHEAFRPSGCECFIQISQQFFCAMLLVFTHANGCCVYLRVCVTLKLLEKRGRNSLNSVSPIAANKE